ncbi:hypothetical protein ACWC9H_27155 [Streptomyces sp. NPDC001251]
MSQYDDSTREVYDAVSEAMAETIRLAVLLAALAAEMMVEAREERLQRAREESEARARAELERVQAERAAAEPLLRAVHQERFWRDLDPQRDAQKIARSWQAASEWAGSDPYAAHTLQHLREQLKSRFGIEVPEWEVGGKDLARVLALSDPAFERVLSQARAAAGAMDEASYVVLIRDLNDPYAVVFRGEVSAAMGQRAQAVGAQHYLAWARGAGAELVQGDDGRFSVEVVENTGQPDAANVPAAVLRGDGADAVRREEAAWLRAVVRGTETGVSDRELFYALSVHLEELREEEWRRIGRREGYAQQLAGDGLTASDRRRLEGNVEAVNQGLGALRQEQADAALRMAATAATIRGENPQRVYDAARLTETLDAEWWATASGPEIAGVWEYVQGWEAGQARDAMQDALSSSIERHHAVRVLPGDSADMVRGLFGGSGVEGPAVPLTRQGDVLREEAQRLFDTSFDAFTRATRLEREAERQSGAYAEALREQAALFVDQAVLDGQRGTVLLDQGTWLDREASSAVTTMYAENSSKAAQVLAAEFEAQWGRPLSAEGYQQLVEATEEMYAQPATAAHTPEAAASVGPSGGETVAQAAPGGASTDPAAFVVIPGQVLSGVEEAVDGREDERRAEAAGKMYVNSTADPSPRAEGTPSGEREAPRRPTPKRPAPGEREAPRRSTPPWGVDPDAWAVGVTTPAKTWPDRNVEDPSPVQEGANTDPVSMAVLPGQALRSVEEAVEGVADAREDERRAEAAQAVSALGDAEVTEAVRLGSLGYPKGAEAATERAPAQSRGAAPEGREHGREIERQGL